MQVEDKTEATTMVKNTCILAGAGSGKTRTLVQLIVEDLKNGIPPTNIVAFTFTKKAADELLVRVINAVKQDLPDTLIDDLFIGTIHSWCLKFLHNHDEFINFTPLDELQLNSLIIRLYDYLKLDKAYNGKFPIGIDSFLKDLEIYYNEDVSDDLVPNNLVEPITSFRQVLQRNRLLTYGEMVKHAIDLLNREGLPNLQRLYVDEFQDVNPAQVTLINAMKGHDTNLTVVGDDLQCIYNWRGSDIRRILRFPEEYPDTEIIRLNKNYRSESEIVNLCSQFSDTIEIRDKEKKIVAGKPGTAGKHVFWLPANSETQQASKIADTIEKYLSSGIAAHDIAILLRSVINSGPAIVNELEKRKIPVQCPILGRGGRFINDFAIPLFKWLSIDQTKQRNEHEEAEMGKQGDALWDSAQEFVKVDEIAFWGAVEVWIQEIEANESDAYNIRGSFYNFLASVGITISNEDPTLMVSIGLTSQIVRSVEEIHRRRIKGIDRKTVRGITTECHIALSEYQLTFGESSQLVTDLNGVIVTTVHQAKGLEWPVVFLPELNRSVFPSKARPHGTSFSNDVAGRYGTTLEDEKRLFYVAASRAKNKLFLLSNSPATKRESKFIDSLVEKNVITISESLSDNEIFFTPEESVSHSELVKIGLSDLLIYLQCPFQYGLRRIVRVQPEVGDELGYGKGLHELIQRRFSRTEPWTASELDKEVENSVSLPYTSETLESNSREAIKKRYKALESIGLFKNDVNTEIPITIYIGNAVINIQIDGIVCNEDNSVSIVDWKSTLHDDFLPRYQEQIQFYAYAMRHKEYVVRDAFLIDIKKSAQTGTLASQGIDISPHAITHLLDQINTAISGITASRFLPNSTKENCSGCDMKKLCNYKYSDHE
jgi:DNA helicase-2/ATP-dependent DNA helicase PcrA